MKKNLKTPAAIISFMLTVIFCSTAFTPSGYKVGDKAKDFYLKNVDGKMVSMANIKDAKGFIITFTCNHCPFSVAYEDRIIALHQKYAPLGYPVIAINPNDESIVQEDSYDNMVIRAKEKNFPFVYLQDQTQDIAKTYGALKTPHVYIVSKKGNDLVVEYIGAIDDNTDDVSAVKNKYVENAMSEILAGEPVSVSSTKAIGCSVKYRQQ
jgi:peroxiredoxin